MIWFGVIYPVLCGYGWFIVWFGCDLVLNDLVWYYWVRLRQSWFVFGVVWCLMVSFRVIFTVFGSNGCFIVWFGCDLILNHFVWYYWDQVRSVLFLLLVWICVFWCGLVWFVYFLVVINVFWCDFGVICFWMIWCDIIEVRFGLTWFFLVWFGVFWCGLVWFVYFLVVINVFWCD